MRYILAIFCLVGVIQVATGQTSVTNNQSVRIPMAGFLMRSIPTAEEKMAVPQMLTFPAGYVDQLISSNGQSARIVGLPEDIEKVSKNLTVSDIKSGIFIFDVSESVAFDPITKKFNVEPEPELRAQLERGGAINISIRETVSADVHVLQILCELRGRHVFLAYMPLSIEGGPAIKVSYKHPPIFTEVDRDNWDRFISGLGS